jgi:UDPglucose 6-dehydrogenase
MKVAVIGTGYVGLVTAVCLAETGNAVIGIDTDASKIELLSGGTCTIYENGLDKLLSKNLAEGRISFTTNYNPALTNAELVFLALPTPPNGDGSADRSILLSAVEKMLPLLSENCILITKSTVPVGTADLIKQLVTKHTTKKVHVVSNPEFLREGLAVEDFMKPDRIIVGTDNDYPKQKLTTLYEPYVKQGNPLFFMDIPSAELTKYASNAFLATKISFMNELSRLCEKVGATIDDIRLGMGADHRIGKDFLYAGLGYGGSCFPKDVQALIHMSQINNAKLNIVEAVHQTNHEQYSFFYNKIANHYQNKLNGLQFAVWGLAFKSNTDDIRESPAVQLIQKLLQAGASVKAYDPEAMPNVAKMQLVGLELCAKEYDVLENSDALIIATEWGQFRNPNFDFIKEKLSKPVVFDGRNSINKNIAAQNGFTYYGIGR